MILCTFSTEKYAIDYLKILGQRRKKSTSRHKETVGKNGCRSSYWRTGACDGEIKKLTNQSHDSTSEAVWAD